MPEQEKPKTKILLKIGKLRRYARPKTSPADQPPLTLEARDVTLTWPGPAPEPAAAAAEKENPSRPESGFWNNIWKEIRDPKIPLIYWLTRWIIPSLIWILYTVLLIAASKPLS